MAGNQMFLELVCVCIHFFAYAHLDSNSLTVFASLPSPSHAMGMERKPLETKDERDDADFLYDLLVWGDLSFSSRGWKSF